MPKKGTSIFMVFTDIDDRYCEEFNAWYNTEHLPEMLALPGFLDAARYVATKGGPRYVAVFELADKSALQTPEFRQRKRSPWGLRIAPSAIGKNRCTVAAEQFYPPSEDPGERGMAPALQIGRMSVPQDIEQAWNDWYSNVFIPGKYGVAGLIYARRFRVIEGATKYLTVYEFENDKVSESEDWKYRRVHAAGGIYREMRDAMCMAEGSPGIYKRIFP